MVRTATFTEADAERRRRRKGKAFVVGVRFYDGIYKPESILLHTRATHFRGRESSYLFIQAKSAVGISHVSIRSPLSGKVIGLFGKCKTLRLQLQRHFVIGGLRM